MGDSRQLSHHPWWFICYETLKTELLTAHKAALKELFKYYQSTQGYDFSNEQKPIVQAIANDLDFISINTLIEKYVEECKRGEVWNAKTTTETQSSLNLLAELLGNETNAATLNHKNARHVKDIITKLPP